MSDPEVQRATEDETAALAAAYRSAYAENRRLGLPAKAESATEGEVAEWIGEHRVLVAEPDGEVVGGVRLEATGADRVTLNRLGVRADRKGEGVGSALLDRAEAAVRDRGYRTV